MDFKAEQKAKCGVVVLPVWRKNHSACEFLTELATFSIERPEVFARIAVVFEDECNSDDIKHSYLKTWGIETNGMTLQVLETAKLELWDRIKGRGPK